MVRYRYFSNSLPKDRILDLTKLKAFADDKFNVAYMNLFYLRREENIVGKGENAGYQHFLLFPMFSIAFFCTARKTRDSLGTFYQTTTM